VTGAGIEPAHLSRATHPNIGGPANKPLVLPPTLPAFRVAGRGPLEARSIGKRHMPTKGTLTYPAIELSLTGHVARRAQPEPRHSQQRPTVSRESHMWGVSAARCPAPVSRGPTAGPDDQNTTGGSVTTATLGPNLTSGTPPQARNRTNVRLTLCMVSGCVA